MGIVKTVVTSNSLKVLAVSALTIVAASCASSEDAASKSVGRVKSPSTSPDSTAQVSQPAEATVTISSLDNQPVRLNVEITGPPPPFFVHVASPKGSSLFALGFDREMTIQSEWPTTVFVATGSTSFALNHAAGNWTIEPLADGADPELLLPGGTTTTAIRFVANDVLPPEGEYTVEVPIAFWTEVADEAPSGEPDGFVTLRLTYTILPVASLNSLEEFCTAAVAELTGSHMLSAGELLGHLDIVQGQAQTLSDDDRELITADVNALRRALRDFLGGLRGFDSSVLVEDVNKLCGSSLTSTATELGD
jgi:hypothetical protein